MCTDEQRRSATLTSLWHFYDEHAAQARQHENLRATVTSTLAGIAAAVVTLAGVGGFTKADILAGAVVIILSVLGMALSIKHYERNRMHTAILGAVRNRIDDLLETRPEQRMGKLREIGEQRHQEKFSLHEKREGPFWPKRVRLHLLWLMLPMGIGIVGILIVVLAAVGVRLR